MTEDNTSALLQQIQVAAEKKGISLQEILTAVESGISASSEEKADIDRRVNDQLRQIERSVKLGIPMLPDDTRTTRGKEEAIAIEGVPNGTLPTPNADQKLSPLSDFGQELLNQKRESNGAAGLQKQLERLGEKAWHDKERDAGVFATLTSGEKRETRREIAINEFKTTHPKFIEEIGKLDTEAVSAAGKEFKSELIEALEEQGVKLETVASLQGDPAVLSISEQAAAARIASGELNASLRGLGTSLSNITAIDGDSGSITPVELQRALDLVDTAKSTKTK